MIKYLDTIVFPTLSRYAVNLRWRRLFSGSYSHATCLRQAQSHLYFPSDEPGLNAYRTAAIWTGHKTSYHSPYNEDKKNNGSIALIRLVEMT